MTRRNRNESRRLAGRAERLGHRHQDVQLPTGSLRAEFHAEYKVAIRAIAADPRLQAPVEDVIAGLEIRERLIERFEQRVIFLIDGGIASIVAVVHAIRRPGAWHGRLGEG